MGQVLSVPLTPSDIRDAYRFSGKPGTVRPIVSEFTSVSTKQNFLAATKSFNKKRSLQDKLNTSHLGYLDTCSPVYVVEYLPGSMRKLNLSREFAKANNFKFCWSSNGRILIQKDEQSKAIHIKNEQILDETRDQMWLCHRLSTLRILILFLITLVCKPVIKRTYSKDLPNMKQYIYLYFATNSPHNIKHYTNKQNTHNTTIGKPSKKHFHFINGIQRWGIRINCI